MFKILDNLRNKLHEINKEVFSLGNIAFKNPSIEGRNHLIEISIFRFKCITTAHLPKLELVKTQSK